MSRTRTGHQPDDWTPNEPAVGRIHMTRYGMRGGGAPIVGGAYPTGESDRDRAARQQRESRQRLREAE